MMKTKLFIVGTINDFCLETSYATAGKNLNLEVIRFDPSKELIKHVKLGKIGRIINEFLSVEVWVRKMNRDMIVKVKELKPDYILIAGGSRVLYGTLATIKLLLPDCKIAWVWPDTPMNLTANNLNCARLFDLSATYSRESVAVFKALGFNNVQWIPLAGDMFMHGVDVNSSEFMRDISFVGMWRPEREKFMKIICENFGHLSIEIYGNYWKRNCSDKNVMSRWKGEGFYANDLAQFFNKSRININIIDDTNYPAANMRFFEIPTSGGLQVCSKCPEWELIFQDKKDIVYFNNEEELVEKVKWVLTNIEKAQEIRTSAQQLIKQSHNYSARLQDILEKLNSTK